MAVGDSNLAFVAALDVEDLRGAPLIMAAQVSSQRLLLHGYLGAEDADNLLRLIWPENLRESVLCSTCVFRAQSLS